MPVKTPRNAPSSLKQCQGKGSSQQRPEDNWKNRLHRYQRFESKKKLEEKENGTKITHHMKIVKGI